MRWRDFRFPLVVLILGFAVLAVLWCTSLVEYDDRNFLTIPVVLTTVILLFVWFQRGSAAPARIKRIALWTLLATVATLAALFRLAGFSGDFAPRFVPRWQPRPDEALRLPSSIDRHNHGALADPRPTPFDYPQFLGPGRNAEVTSVRLARSWKQRPPKRMWKRSIGAGWSGFAVVGEYAFTQEQRGARELVACYRVPTGRLVWSHADEGRFRSVVGGDGPRATPTVYQGNVVSMGPEGKLNCLDAATGRRLWSRNILVENDVPNLQWGRSGSPLVVGQQVIVNVGASNGRSLVAYDRKSGALLWNAGDDVASYSSPALATLGGVDQVLIVNQDWLASHRLRDGRLLWRHPWPGNSGSNASASQAIGVDDRHVFVSKGYHVGAALLEIRITDDGVFSVEEVWSKPSVLRTKMTNVVIRDGHVYGLSQGILECVELASGQRKWKQGRYGHGQIIRIHDLLLVVAENGEVVLLEASPDGHRELGRFQAIQGKTWNNPALSGPYLLVRNAQVAACYRLPLAEIRRGHTPVPRQESRPADP